MRYGINLLSFLKRKNISQAELAKTLNTTPANVNRWAKGDGVPSYELCKKLLEIGMTTEELFGLSISQNFEENEKDFSLKIRHALLQILSNNQNKT